LNDEAIGEALSFVRSVLGNCAVGATSGAVKKLCLTSTQAAIVSSF
jgi:hypothetical protein